ncbi:hypothetical protein ACIQ57_07185 [Lysinibacillus xylanilyticus]|uniref:hypothetical protein n=1 Tax=Lysinibacillus xylanilyticus TaxID=582475 RepID=UPI00381B738C
MDKETLTILVSTLPERDIVDIYKQKKINNLGFRAGNIDDVRKNRKLLENNLLKTTNVKQLHSYFLMMDADFEWDLKNLSWDEIKALCDEKGIVNVLISLYAHERFEEFKELVSGQLQKELHVEQNPIERKTNDILNEASDSLSESKHIKTIKKLETKLKNLEDENKSKEDIYKGKLDNINKLLKDMRKEKEQYKIDNDKLTRENKELQVLNQGLQQQKYKVESERQQLLNEVQLLKVRIENLESETQPQLYECDNLLKEIVDCTNKAEYQIAIFGHPDEILINNTKHVGFEFIGGEAIKEFNTDKNNKYDEIWIIYYDLTQKEKHLINKKQLKNNKSVEVKIINNLKELNQNMSNLEKVRG